MRLKPSCERLWEEQFMKQKASQIRRRSWSKASPCWAMPAASIIQYHCFPDALTHYPFMILSRFTNLTKLLVCQSDIILIFFGMSISTLSPELPSSKNPGSNNHTHKSSYLVQACSSLNHKLTLFPKEMKIKLWKIIGIQSHSRKLDLSGKEGGLCLCPAEATCAVSITQKIIILQMALPHHFWVANLTELQAQRSLG